MRSARTLSASQSASGSVSSPETPRSTSRPLPIAETWRPPTDAEARLTRCTSARISVAQLRRHLLWRHDVECKPGAELEAGEMGQARQDVDPPAEVLRSARRSADPQVERRARAEPPGQSR